MSVRFTPVACVLLASLGLSGVLIPTPAGAQSSNSIEGFMNRVFGPPEHGKRSHEPHKRSADKPRGEPRQKAEARTVPTETPAAPSAAPVPVPSPDPRPETDATTPTTGAKPSEPVAPAKQEGASEPVQGAEATDAPTPVPGQPNALQPAPIENQPPEDIPVPEKRPPEPAEESAQSPAPSEPAKPAAPGEAKPPVEGQAGVEPAKPDDAPNSTEKLKSREPTIDPATSVVAAAAVEDAEACEKELKTRGVVFEVKSTISEGECGVLRPVSFERSSTGIKVSPGTQMLCRTALALDMWLTDSVAPAAKANFPDRKLTEFRQASTYVCRPRASENGISEHARGSAIDIGAFAFDKGEDIGVAAQSEGSAEAKFQDAVRAGACGPFKTVLGPGTDPDHATHFHLDIAARRNGATYCK